MADLLLFGIGLIATAGMLWKAYRTREQSTWYLIGALGWIVFALSGVTDGLIKIALAVGAILIFGISLLVRRSGKTDRNTEPT